MNSITVLELWLQILGLVALEIALVVAFLTIVGGRIRSGTWRLRLWRMGLLTVVLLVAGECSGLARQWRVRPRPGPNAPGKASTPNAYGLRDAFVAEVAVRRIPARSAAGNDRAVVENAPASARVPSGAAAVERASARFGRAPVDVAAGTFRLLVLVLVWAAGTAVVAMRFLLARAALWAVFVRRLPVQDAMLERRFADMAGLLHLRRRVRLLASSRLTAPITFGVVRPTVVIPAGFTTNHGVKEQEVMLAHELAHVAAGDPLWRAMSDGVATVLWWHPGIWWMRRQIGAASEAAADEASLLVAGGPKVLAECLVALGRAAAHSPLAAQGLGMAGFRSELGRRVDALLRLPGTSWPRSSWNRSMWVRLGGPITLGFLVIAVTAPLTPLTSQPEDPMNTMRTCWTQSLAAVALLGTLSDATSAAPNGASAHELNAPTQAEVRAPIRVAAASGTRTESRPEGNFEPVAAASTGGSSPRQEVFDSTSEDTKRRMRERYGIVTSGPANRQDDMVRVMRERYGIATSPAPAPWESKLSSIVFDELGFDGIPLPEAIRHLMEESRRLDPDHEGVNFLLSPAPASPSTAGVDPTTGQLVGAAPAADPGTVILRLEPPLRHVRLGDALDVMVKVADQPIQYTKEPYGVVVAMKNPAISDPGFGVAQNIGFEAGASPPPEPLAVSTFRIEKSDLVKGLESAFDVHMDKLAPEDSEPRRLQAALKQLLRLLGVGMDSEGKSVFYNELTGILMVRATAEDLEVVRAAVETLGGSSNPPFAMGTGIQFDFGGRRGFSTGGGIGGSGFGGGFGGGSGGTGGFGTSFGGRSSGGSRRPETGEQPSTDANHPSPKPDSPN